MMSDNQLLEILKINKATLKLFKKVRSETIKEAKLIAEKKNKKLKVLGVSGSARDASDTAQESSNSEELLKKCLEFCQELGAETEMIPLRRYDVKYCKACYSTANTQCHFYCTCYPRGEFGDDMTNIIYDKLLGADIIIFATPVNNFKISTLMATFIDRCISMDGSLKPADPDSPKDKDLNKKHMKFIELTAANNIPGSGMLKRFAGKVAGIIVTAHEAGASMAITNLFMTLNHFGMLFPPFSNVYAVSSVCNPTYEDKKIVLNDCYKKEVRLLAENVMAAAKIIRYGKPTDWKYDLGAN